MTSFVNGMVNRNIESSKNARAAFMKQKLDKVRREKQRRAADLNRRKMAQNQMRRSSVQVVRRRNKKHAAARKAHHEFVAAQDEAADEEERQMVIDASRVRTTVFAHRKGGVGALICFFFVVLGTER